MNSDPIKVMYAIDEHTKYSEKICQLIYESALQRGTGIAKRSPEYISQKITSGKAVVALDGERLVGFSYIESWGHDDFVATSGLIVDPEYRHRGLAARIKDKTFELARHRFPDAKIFSITTSLPVMKLNTRLGYKPVTFSELTDDDEFWKGCEGCKNYDVLQRNDRLRCICTGMLFDPKDPAQNQSRWTPFIMNVKNRMKNLFSVKK
ncbi:MAG: GNAT family N-acetyltransferase [Bacteroidaceae bacterium]|nr:GNAT family N-acetyltransferase [Bacteroidaceae bacterium]